MRRSSVPSFRADGLKFTCFISDDGQNYIWRTDDGRAEAGRSVKVFWARCDGKAVGREHGTLKAAMSAAARVYFARRAAA